MTLQETVLSTKTSWTTTHLCRDISVVPWVRPGHFLGLLTAQGKRARVLRAALTEYLLERAMVGGARAERPPER